MKRAAFLALCFSPVFVAMFAGGCGTTSVPGPNGTTNSLPTILGMPLTTNLVQHDAANFVVTGADVALLADPSIKPDLVAATTALSALIGQGLNASTLSSALTQLKVSAKVQTIITLSAASVDNLLSPLIARGLDTRPYVQAALNGVLAGLEGASGLPITVGP